MADPSHTPVERSALEAEDQVLDSLHGVDRTDSNRPVGDERADELVALRREIELLREVVGEAVVERAEGALMLRYGIDANRAYEILTGWSQECNIDLHTLADALINVVCTESEHGQAIEPTVLRWIEEQLRRDPGADVHAVISPELRRW